MKAFCCFAMGENFPGELRGKSDPFGFFVSVFVNAIDSKDAEAKALQLLSEDSALTASESAGFPPNATVSFKVVHELAHQVMPKLTEFQFFDMDD